MAHRITYKPQGRLLSSAVGEITVAVEGEYVDVTLTATGGIVIRSERYYAYGGYVTLYDLGSLIEAEMRKSGQPTGDSLSSIIADAASFAAVRPGDIMLLNFTVSCGLRSISCFVDNSLDDHETFYFRNCFNVWDWATLPVAATAKTDVDHSIAILNGKSRFYNQSTAKTYDVQTGPLTSYESEWIDQLSESKTWKIISNSIRQ